MAENVLFCQPHTVQSEERCVLFLSVLVYHFIERFLIFKVAFILTGIYPNNNNSTDNRKSSFAFKVKQTGWQGPGWPQEGLLTFITVLKINPILPLAIVTPKTGHANSLFKT